MKKLQLLIVFIAGMLGSLAVTAFRDNRPQEAYVLEHEKEIAVNETGPHNGGGESIAFPFFSKAADFNLVFRKRVLKPGSSIGYHLQEKDEVYYVSSGNGEMTVNGTTFRVTAGDAILTRAGNSHRIKPSGSSNLVLIINYEK